MLAIRLTCDRLGELAEQMHDKASEAVRATAFAIQDRAQALAPVDTGALRNSHYTATRQGSGYGDAAQAAARANPEVPLLPEVSAPRDDMTAIVAVGAEYGMHVEYGTKRQPPRPYLTPAAESMRDEFTQAMTRLLA